MSDGRKYYCFCDSNCKFETMTREQILAAIAQAIETGVVVNPDSGFITKVKETNSGGYITFWVGTRAQYNALQNVADNCVHIVTDDTTAKDIENMVKAANESARSAETAAAAAVAIAEKFGKESAEHAGCYYRVVDGETEWINPPTEIPDTLGRNTYRTAERYRGKPVYKTVINFAAIHTTEIVFAQDRIEVVDIKATATPPKGFEAVTLPAYDESGKLLAFARVVNPNEWDASSGYTETPAPSCKLTTFDGFDGYNVVVEVKYIKLT